MRSFFRRLLILSVVGVLGGGGAAHALYQLQVVHAAEYVSQAKNYVTTTTTLSAARGEIYAQNGEKLVSNTLCYDIVLDCTYWDFATQNETLNTLAHLVKTYGGEMACALPIDYAYSYEYTAEESSTDCQKLIEFLQHEDLWESAEMPTGNEVYGLLIGYYGINTTQFTDAECHAIAAWRYTLDTLGFSRYTPVIFAENVSIQLATVLAEMHDLQGVSVQARVERTYDSPIAAHILGTTGMIYAEEWAEYKENGYAMDEIVGKSGLELALEPYLRSTEGSRMVQTDSSGAVVIDTVAVAPKAGNHCTLTIDYTLQTVAEASMAQHFAEIDAFAGAVVVLEVNTGKVLAMASYPTYNLATFSADYNTLLEDSRSPLYNRSIQGLYAPGSTYKMITATAALSTGVLQANETYTCDHVYTRYADHVFTCLGTHGDVDVVTALQKSCNVFFYEMGYRLGGAVLEEWAQKFGFGQKTGIDIAGEATGLVAGPINRINMQEIKSYYEDWQEGDALQAAIGQSDNAFTPLQMASYMATLVNGGVRYQPYLLDAVTTFDGAEIVLQSAPIVTEVVDVEAEILEIIKQGMGAVVGEGGTAAQIFADVPYTLGGKSGTAQTGLQNVADNGVFLAFAPYENPEIAVCVVGEQAGSGAAVAPVVKDILDAYFSY